MLALLLSIRLYTKKRRQINGAQYVVAGKVFNSLNASFHRFYSELEPSPPPPPHTHTQKKKLNGFSGC